MDFTSLPGIKGFVCKGAHPYEPLLTKVWFNGGVAAIAVSNFMLMFLYSNEISKFVELLGHLVAGHFCRKATEFLRTDIVEG